MHKLYKINIYHDELNKPEVQQDSDIIKGYSAWKDCKDSLIPMHRFISMTTNVINILQDRHHRMSCNPTDEESQARLKCLEDSLKFFMEWKDDSFKRCTQSNRKSTQTQMYKKWFTKECSDDFIGLIRGMINLIKCNTSLCTRLTSDNTEEEYHSYILLRGISQDRQENRFALLKSIIRSRNGRENAMTYKWATKVDTHIREIRACAKYIEGRAEKAYVKTNCPADLKYKKKQMEKNQIAFVKNAVDRDNGVESTRNDLMNAEEETLSRRKHAKSIMATYEFADGILVKVEELD